MGESKLDLTENMVNQPGKEILFAHLASNLLREGKLEQAIKYCEKGLKKFPTYAQAHYILARCYIRKKMNDEARAELERVLRYDPNHFKAIRDLAALYFANGFQDLYKEYLLQLLTLDPMNDKVIAEAKKLDEYKLWTEVSEESVSPPPHIEPEPDLEYDEDKENVFVESEDETPKESDTKSIFPDKIDLSQFDNVEDDFTTILHGKLEYSRKVEQKISEKNQDLAEIAKDIINEKESEDKTKSMKGIDQDSSGSDQSQGPDNENLKSDLNADDDAENRETKSDIGISDQSSDQYDTAEKSGEITQSSGMFTSELMEEENGNDASEMSEELPDEESDKFEQPKIISQTLGEILVSQQKYVEAKAVFIALKEKQPENKALDLKIEYLDRIIGLEKKGK